MLGRAVFHEPDPFFGGQKTGELFIAPADRVPPAPRSLGDAGRDAGARVRAVPGEGGIWTPGKRVEGLHEYVTQELRRADAYVRRVIEHGDFDGQPLRALVPSPRTQGRGIG